MNRKLAEKAKIYHARFQPPRERLYSCKRSMSFIIRVAFMVNFSLHLRPLQKSATVGRNGEFGRGCPRFSDLQAEPAVSAGAILWEFLRLNLRRPAFIGAAHNRRLLPLLVLHAVMTQTDKLQEYLQRLTPAARGNLLTELERLELCGAEIPGAASIIEILRAEFRTNGQNLKHRSPPSRYFFAPLEPLLVDGAPEHANTGAIQRGSLAAIWEWISRDLLPTMARDYVKLATELITADRQGEARRAASTFQTKVVKSLENTLGSPDSSSQIRSRLAAYTASPTVFDDLTKMLGVLRAREALAKFNEALPDKIAKFDGAQFAKVKALLDAFAKQNAEQVPFALTLVAGRLKTPWQLIRLATKAAASKNAADVAAAPYAIAVSMVLDRLEDKRALLRFALKNERILVAREILVGTYDTEYALQVRIDQFAQSDWGRRLDELMASIAALVESEVSRFPDNVGHILGSRSLRSHQSLSARMTYWVWKGRDVVSDGLAFCRNLVGGPERSRA